MRPTRCRIGRVALWLGVFGVFLLTALGVIAWRTTRLSEAPLG